MDAEAYKKPIYADNAATTKMSETALRAYIDCAAKAFANPSSDHEAGMEAKKYLEKARKTVGDAFSAENGKVIFTSCGSEADNQAILSAAKYGKSVGKKHIITTSFEHHAVLKTVKSLEDAGFEATYLPIQKNGTVKLADVEKAFREDTFLVSVMAVNNEVGTIQPIKQIGRLCKKHGVLFHVDGVQAAGKIPINIEESNIDYLAISAHKFRGPKGVGALITSEKAPLTPAYPRRLAGIFASRRHRKRPKRLFYGESARRSDKKHGARRRIRRFASRPPRKRAFTNSRDGGQRRPEKAYPRHVKYRFPRRER